MRNSEELLCFMCNGVGYLDGDVCLTCEGNGLVRLGDVGNGTMWHLFDDSGCEYTVQVRWLPTNDYAKLFYVRKFGLEDEWLYGDFGSAIERGRVPAPKAKKIKSVRAAVQKRYKGTEI